MNNIPVNEQSLIVKWVLKLRWLKVISVNVYIYIYMMKETWQFLLQWIGWYKPAAHLEYRNVLLKQEAFEISMLNKNHIFLCVGMLCCANCKGTVWNFQSTYWNFLGTPWNRTQNPTQTLKDVYFIHSWKFNSSSGPLKRFHGSLYFFYTTTPSMHSHVKPSSDSNDIWALP